MPDISYTTQILKQPFKVILPKPVNELSRLRRCFIMMGFKFYELNFVGQG